MLRLVLVIAAIIGLSAPAYAAKPALFEGLFGTAGVARVAPSRVKGPLTITVDISTQTMTVSADGRTIYSFDVSTGRRGYATPTGKYRPIRMHEMWYSSKYENAPMPHAIFFYGGYAIHGTTDIAHLGHVASHGCVRLHPDNAAKLFALVERVGMKNTRITLVRS